MATQQRESPRAGVDLSEVVAASAHLATDHLPFEYYVKNKQKNLKPLSERLAHGSERLAHGSAPLVHGSEPLVRAGGSESNAGWPVCMHSVRT